MRLKALAFAQDVVLVAYCITKKALPPWINPREMFPNELVYVSRGAQIPSDQPGLEGVQFSIPFTVYPRRLWPFLLGDAGPLDPSMRLGL